MNTKLTSLYLILNISQLIAAITTTDAQIYLLKFNQLLTGVLCR